MNNIGYRIPCSACNTSVANIHGWVSHIRSKAHVSKVRKTHSDAVQCRRSLYITGTDLDEFTMAMYFSNYGLVMDIQRIQRKNKGTFYFLEFATEQMADIALNTVHTLSNRALIVRRRVPEVSHANIVDHDRLARDLMLAECPESQLDALVGLVSMTPEEVQSRQLFLSELEAWFKRQVHANVTFSMFGSCVSELGLRGADLDVFVANLTPQATEQKHLVKKLASYLRGWNGMSNLCPIAHARVPILKAFSKTMGVNVDFSFRSEIGVRNSQLIRVYVRSDPRIRRVVMLLRWWAKTYNITANGRNPGGGFTNYTFTWLVLFYLMNTSKNVPPVKELQKNCQPDVVEGWHCGFSRELRCNFGEEVCLVKTLHQFFNFYANMDFAKWVLCPLAGTKVPRGQFATCDQLDPDFDHYKAAVAEGREAMALRTPVCLQDPFELNFNPARGVSVNGLKNFVAQCQQAFAICNLWWTDANDTGSLYPIISLAMGDAKARQMCQNHYRVPFPPWPAAPARPSEVALIDMIACPLAHVFAKSGPASVSAEAHVEFWANAVAAVIKEILAQVLFFDVWELENNELKNEVTGVLQQNAARLTEVIEKELAGAEAVIAGKQSQLDEARARLELLNNQLSGPLPDGAAKEIRTERTKLIQKERKLARELGVRSRALEELEKPESVLGSRGAAGPTLPRNTRAETLFSKLEQKTSGEVVAKFFCEVAHPTLLYRGGFSKRVQGHRMLKEQMAVAKHIYTLNDPRGFNLDADPARQMALVVAKTEEPTAVRVFIAESSTRPGSGTALDQPIPIRVINYLAYYLEHAVLYFLDEKDAAAYGNVAGGGEEAENDGDVEPDAGGENDEDESREMDATNGAVHPGEAMETREGVEASDAMDC